MTLTWKPSTCTLDCARSLDAQFKQIPAVAGVTIYPLVGKAELRWKPTASFSYAPLNAAVRMVGPSIFQLFVKVRGTIRANPDGSYQILSIGDNTPFTLVGPLSVQPNQYTVNYSSTNHSLTPENIAVLNEAILNHYIATIQGPLFEFWRTPPLYLLATQIQLIKPEQTSPATTPGITAPTPMQN